MVVGEFLGRQLFPAVLASVFIPGVNVLPGEFNRRLRSLHKAKQPHHRRQLQGKADRVDFATVLLNHLHLTQHEQSNGLQVLVEHVSKFAYDKLKD